MQKIFACAAALGIAGSAAVADDPDWVSCMQRFDRAIEDISAANAAAIEEMNRLSKIDEFRENSDDFADLFGAIASVSVIASSELSSMAMEICFRHD